MQNEIGCDQTRFKIIQFLQKKFAIKNWQKSTILYRVQIHLEHYCVQAASESTLNKSQSAKGCMRTRNLNRYIHQHQVSGRKRQKHPSGLGFTVNARSLLISKVLSHFFSSHLSVRLHLHFL